MSALAIKNNCGDFQYKFLILMSYLSSFEKDGRNELLFIIMGLYYNSNANYTKVSFYEFENQDN